MKLLVALTLFICLVAGNALGDEESSKSLRKPASGAPPQSKRTKSLSFEDELVEGLNKNPLDSLENMVKKDSRSQPHLYKKRSSFREEQKNTRDEWGYVQ